MNCNMMGGDLVRVLTVAGTAGAGTIGLHRQFGRFGFLENLAELFAALLLLGGGIAGRFGVLLLQA